MNSKTKRLLALAALCVVSLLNAALFYIGHSFSETADLMQPQSAITRMLAWGTDLSVLVFASSAASFLLIATKKYYFTGNQEEPLLDIQYAPHANYGTHVKKSAR